MTKDTNTDSVARSVLRRRSWRVYTEAPLAPQTSAFIARAGSLAPTVLGSGSARVILVDDPRESASLTSVLTSGLVGKGNLWLRSAPPSAYAVLVGDAARGARDGARLFYNVDAAIAGEMVVLAATDLGLGSCWMAAVNTKAAERHLGLGTDERIPAVIALGHTGVRRKGALLAVGWDRVSRVAISNRRKSLEALCSLDRFDSGRSLPPADLSKTPSSGRSLIDVMEGMSPTSSFGGQSPSEEELAFLVESMRLAPSAENAQTWRFVVVRGSSQTAKLLRDAGFVLEDSRSPGALIVMSAAPFMVKKVRREQPFSLMDHPIALTHALLLAETMGLKWGLSFIFDGEALRRRVGIPGSHEITALLALDAEGELAKPPYPDHVQLFRRAH